LMGFLLVLIGFLLTGFDRLSAGVDGFAAGFERFSVGFDVFFSIGLDRLSIMIIGIGVRQVLMNKTQQQTKHRRCEQTQQTLSCANIFAMSRVQQQRNIAHRIKRNIAHRCRSQTSLRTKRNKRAMEV